MKKYLLGLIALLGIVVFSAFGLANDSKNSDTEYYFYEVVNGDVNTSNPLNPGDPMTIDEFEQEDLIDCPEGVAADCVRAWEVGHSPTTSGAGDYTITKSL